MLWSKDLKELLDSEAHRINNLSFIDADPVQFPRRFDKLQDIEIVSFLVASIAWGNRKMICKDAEKMLSLMQYDPYYFIMDEGYEDLDSSINIHRTFFGRHLKHYLKGLHAIYSKYTSIDAFAQANKVGEKEAPSWELVASMQKYFTEANNGDPGERSLPLNLKQTALKRINMALRWLVRDDGIVDMGVWKSIPKRKLYIPLDVHVGNVAGELGLLKRKSFDRKAVEQLTGVLREMNSEDPVLYDFALFGIGIESKQR